MTPALLFSLVAVVSYAALLVLVFRRGLRVRVNQLFALYLAAMLMWQAAYIIVSLSRTDDTALLGYRLSTAAVTAQFILFCFFVRALLRIRERAGLILLGSTIWLAGMLAGLTDQAHFLIGIRRDEITGLFVPEYGPFIALTAVSTVGFLCYGLVNLTRGLLRASTDAERNRLRYLLVAILIILVGASANMVPAFVGYPVDVVANILSAVLFAYAILRYQLLDITLVVRRGLAYSSLTAIIAIVYLLSILLFERLARAYLQVGAYLVPIILAMVAAILLEPWRDKAQAWVDRLLFREKYDTRRMLQEISRQTATIIDLEALGSLLLNTICQKMHLERAGLLLREGDGGDFRLAADVGLGAEAANFRLGHDHPVVQWLLHSDTLLHARELDTIPRFRSLWGQEREELAKLGADLFIPLQVKKDLVGVLVVGPKKSGEAHSEGDQMTLSTLANQTAVAVENARLFASTRARVAEVTALQEYGVRLVSARHLPAVLRVVAEGALRLLGADEAHVALYDPFAERFRTHQGYSLQGGSCELSWSSAAAIPLRMAAHNGQPTVIPDLRLHSAVPPSLAKESPILAVAAWPLHRGEATSGVLAVMYRQPHPFQEEHLRLLGMLSDEASLAIDNAQLLASEQAKRQLADTLREVSRVIGSTLQLDVLLGLVLEQLRNVVDYDCAAIMLLVGDTLEVGNARGLPEAAGIVGESFAFAEQGLLRQLVDERRPVIRADLMRDERGGSRVLEAMGVRAFIGVPLLVRDQPRGILVMGKASPSHYGDDDLQSAAAFANQAAIAIENARLYQETIAEKRKTDSILRETLSGIVVVDTELRIVTFNAGAESITGFSAGEVMGRRLPEILGQEIASPGSPLGRVIDTGERVPPQETVIQGAAGLHDILQGAVALYDANHRLFGYLLSFADITRLKEVDRLKTDIVANVSHELRTPLASIKAYAELLLDNIEGDDRTLRDQFLHVIDQETDRLSQLISDLLNLSRMEAGRFEVRRVPLDVSEVLSDVLSLLEMQRRGREVTIHKEVPPDLPSLTADREMILLVLRNLLANAIKFSHRGGKVLVALQATPEHLSIRVTDHGIGIPQEAIPHLFQKFYRTSTASEAGVEGTGLGLVLTKQAVVAHGGSIEVQSELGVGSTFTVHLPWH